MTIRPVERIQIVYASIRLAHHLESGITPLGVLPSKNLATRGLTDPWIYMFNHHLMMCFNEVSGSIESLWNSCECLCPTASATSNTQKTTRFRHYSGYILLSRFVVL